MGGSFGTELTGIKYAEDSQCLRELSVQMHGLRGMEVKSGRLLTSFRQEEVEELLCAHGGHASPGPPQKLKG